MKLWLFSLGVASKEFKNVVFFDDTEKKRVNKSLLLHKILI